MSYIKVMFRYLRKELTFCRIITLRNYLLNYKLLKAKNLSTINENKSFETKGNTNSKTNFVSDLLSDQKTYKTNEFQIQRNIKTIDNKVKRINKTTDEMKYRFNPLGIQMISKSLRQKIFGSEVDKSVDYDKQTINEIIRQLKSNGLDIKKVKQNSRLNDINIEEYLPKLLANDLSEHFHRLGQQFSDSYKRLAFNLIETQLLELPPKWVFREGWTRYTYDSNGGVVTEKVDFPLENELVFDVEVCMKDGSGQKPTLATAVSPKAWYSWCSPRLAEYESLTENQMQFNSKISLKDMIPMESAVNEEKLIIGHNVSFDRTYIREQYNISADKTRFLDTLSLHMCISGLTQHQRALSYSHKIRENDESISDEPVVKPKSNDQQIDPHIWSGVGSLNNLVDVYHLYCDNEIISKDPRNVFIKGSLRDVFDSFQDLMTYCANDCRITHKIFKTIFPKFLERFPHSITLAGMLEMSVMYLPVVPHNWNRYVSECDSIYEEKERELNLTLREIANDTCSLANDQHYASDVWLWDLDWSTQELRFKIPKTPKTGKTSVRNSVSKPIDKSDETKDPLMSESVSRIMSTGALLKKVQPLMPGYPKWYLEFCSKLRYDFSEEKEITEEDLKWESGPYRISTQMRSVPKLLRLLWNGYPIHYDERHGWGYLVPDSRVLDDCPDRVPGSVDDNKNTIYFPFKEFKELMKRRENQKKKIDLNDKLETLDTELDSFENRSESNKYFEDIIKGCLFYKLPHKGGPDKRVGNPLSKDFLKKVEDGSLTSFNSEITNLVLQQNKILTYWKNSSKRIRSQIVLESDDGINGAILPRVIVAGTVTRRAVEPTWLTASNVVVDRVGSELKSMIQCPKDYHFVGADVDSQELWIASLIGDSHFSAIHGSTGIGWMSLQGNKADGTDMHSKTAASINITRDEAKVLNYARIYGSGQPFASRFLMQSNPSLSAKEAKEKAKKIFTETKGSRRKSLKNLLKPKPIEDIPIERSKREWSGGTESQMFNKLEEIAESPEPRTPVLECRISRALEPRIVKDNYITSRVNWVVQSSAVDFLHIMLVTMQWLMNEMKIEGRFSISIHDEVRYLVKSEDRYKAALALQLSNLLTRSLFAYKLGLNDLPLSVAFFSSVDIDKCLRKEVDIDSKTPSNPLGLLKGYGIPFGESLDILELMKKLKE